MAIPSYQRSEAQVTLKYLCGIGIPKERIYVFVQTEHDYKKYQKYEDRCSVIFAPADGVAKARNNILRYFKGQQDILMLDDDVSYLGRLHVDKIAPIKKAEEFDETIGKCFEQTRRFMAPMFGVYPVNNAFFMQRSISTKVTVNTVVGFLRGQILTFNETFSAKEDIELCARVLHEGKSILRYNFLSVNAKHRTNVGGCYEAWHSTAQKETVTRLCRMYPDILAPNNTKPNEVRMVLKDRKIHIGKKGDKRQ